MKYDISVVGDCVQDIFILSESKVMKQKRKDGKATELLSFLYREKLNVEELHYDLGGSACNAAVAMQDLGVKTTMVSMLGGDIYSKAVRLQLRKRGVGSSFLYDEKNKDLGLSFILLGPDRDRTILTYRAANDFSKINIKRLFKASKAYYIAGINAYSKILVPLILEDAVKKNKKIYINPSIYQIEKDQRMLKKVLAVSEIAVMNLEEARAISGLRNGVDIANILKKIKSIGASIVVVTNGVRGAYVYDGNIGYHSGIIKKKRIDATGAGDSFAGTFVASHRRGFDLAESLRAATVNAGNVISVYGAQRGLLGWKKILPKRGLVKINKIKV